MDFLAEQKHFYISENYGNIYVFLRDNYKIKYQDIFVLCASIGYRKDRCKKVKNKGREFRSNYLSTAQKVTIYSIILNDKELGKQIEKFNDKDFQSTAMNKISAYAEGGMEILCEEVFNNKWNKLELDSSYEEYDVDLLSYIYDETNEVPF